MRARESRETDVAPEYKNAMGDGPRATPAVAGEFVYAFTGEGILAALKAADGKIVWLKDVVSEFGGKPSVVIVATTRSGLGVTTPHGSVTASYGAFGSSTAGADLAYGTQKWGNFIALGGFNSGRFLDPPEKYFWDLGHVYDETNMVLAQRIYPDIRPLVERGLREVR